jgi:Na+/proline symporter
VIAATMSTIDSALLSMSAMVTADLYRPLRPDTPQDRLTRFGKFAAVGVMAAAVLLTLWLKDKTIFSIIVFKHELLIQLAPALMIGVHWKKLTAVPVLTGMVVGTTTAVLMTLGMLGPVTKPLGLHAGVWGLFVNLTLLFGLQLLMSKRAATSHE